MKALQALHADRKRAQRGSVLSAVLIIVAFLAIISGALTTELSTHFLISRALVNRVGNEATVNSAMEVALDQLQNTALGSGCPGAPLPLNLNNRTAVVSYASCWRTVRETPQFSGMAYAAPFNVDGTHSVIPGTGQDMYVVGDSGGKIYSYQFGQSSPAWTPMDLNTGITGPPIAMQDATCQSGDPCPDTGGVGGVNADISYLVPIAGGGASGCSANYCVKLLGQDVPNPPDVSCFMPAGAKVTSRPAAGVAFPLIAYFGDIGGNLYANNATEFSCARVATTTTPDGAAIVAGPVVIKNGNQDEIYIVTSSSHLLHYTYRQGAFSTLSDESSINLPYPTPKGVALYNTTNLAVTFAGSGVATFTFDGSYDPRQQASQRVGRGIASAPFWCSCPGGPQVAVGDSVNGKLYVLDPTNLNPIATYAGGSPIHTTPASDGVGEWFFSTDDGYLHEAQPSTGQSLVQVVQYGPTGAPGTVGGSVQMAACPAGICILVNNMGPSGDAYIVSLDARLVTITSCLSNTPPQCSSDNPRLNTQVEVGAAGTPPPPTVHVQGWSYYSP